jgi:cell division protein FtsI (penicillin-binding protein 3)/stage V sporulation protein D (sporulation-specific penicillin-binding protein)
VSAAREKQANRRIRLLLAVFVLVFAVAFGRAVWLQGVRAASLGQMATRQHHESITLPAGRGTIFDSAGVQLAIGEQTTTVYADPRQLTQPRAVAVAAQRYLGVNANELYPQLLNRKTSFVYVQRFADPKAAEQLLAKGYVGLNGYPEERRTYPQRTVASQVIGFAGTDNKGLGGLEVEYDKQLTGKTGKQTIVRTPSGRAIQVVSATPARAGRDLFTTIDHTIQANAESVLRKTVHDTGAKSATAVVLDPRTGAILAMAQAPGYDANKASKVPLALQRNRAITDTYEPGSTFKLVTIAGAISTGTVTPETKFTLPYSIKVADRVIHDAEPRGTETLTVAQILSHSSNVGAITIAEKLGAPALMEWIEKFGYGKKTGIDFPGESPGQVLPLDKWYGSTIGNVPIGQGIAVTPIQMAAAYAAIANGGVWVEPHLVERVAGRAHPHVARRRIVSPAVDTALKQMLSGVVDEHGATGNAAQIPGYTVAGKTGTAQKPGPHGYTTGKYVASFVGMVPVGKPRFVVLVMVDEPRTAIFGGVVAAPAFAQIAKFDLQYMGVPPDAPVGTVTTG